MSPFELGIILHCYSSSSECPEIQRTPMAMEVINALVSEDILKPTPEYGNNSYGTTEKGRAFVKSILATPYPKLVYVDQLNRIIE